MEAYIEELHPTGLRPINVVILSLAKIISPSLPSTRLKQSRQGRISISGKLSLAGTDTRNKI